MAIPRPNRRSASRISAAPPNARIQTFSYFTLEAEERFGPDLALLVSLIAAGSLKPQIAVERSWRNFLEVGDQLRGRGSPDKAVFLTDRP